MACRNHPQVDQGLDHCYRCGYRFCDECRVDFQGHPHCAACKAEAVSMLEAGSGGGGQAAGDEGRLPPWERRQELGMMTAFTDTIKEVLSSPTRFFANMRLGVTTWDCLAIPCVVTLLATIVASIVNVLVFGSLFGIMASQQGGDMSEAGAAVGSQMIGALCTIPLAPVFAIVFSFIIGGMMHLWLVGTSNVREPFQQTVRGYCYAQSASILGVIPLIGGLIGWGMTLWASVVMIKTIHRTSWLQAWLSVLWIYGVFLVLTCGAIAIIVGAAGVSGQ